MIKKLVSMLSAVALTVSLVGCGSSSTTSATSSGNTASGSGNPIVLKLGHGAATDNPRHLAAEKFAELVKEKTHGKVEVQVFPNEVLGSEPQMVDAVKLGTLDMALADTGIFASMSPKMAAINLPYLFKDYNSAYKVLDGPLGKDMAAPLEQNNIHLLAYWENGFREITNSKHPIHTPADLSGLKMRVPEIPVSVATFKALGTNPTPMAYGQLYTALQSKVVDGQENPLTNIYASKFYEVQKYLTMSNHQYSALPLVINKKKWDSFSPDIQKAIQDAANEARDYHRQLVQQQAKDLVSKLKAKGMVINTPDQAPFREATKDVYKQFADKIGSGFLKKLFAQAGQ
ncbi:TRAP transporter substrate-binding protein [Fodinisporobacter ferrooxydans]|uniref:TRAP transporter substrate-binding protein n=1 Tax=Fodinisporobacter ferrooxydans TaxID=2901836 RepID=A0ABY4CGW8_9BACL|nr:TRAP transporter substrate-binding protein [Alicyclobacillaceae bacterium MYW30-H2]